MQRLILVGCFLAAAAFVLWRATITQQVADFVDRGTRPLGEVTHSAPVPGPVYFENDSYYWLLMAERMRDEGALRIRWTDADNAPFGRPVYWSQSIAWLIRLVALLPGISSQPDPLVTASFWVNPLLEISTLFLLVWLLAPLGIPTVVLSAVLFLGLGDVAWAFSTLRPDHQSLQAASTIIAAAALLRAGFGFGAPRISWAGKEKSPSLQKSWPFALSGAAAGIGLWVSAAAMMPFLIVLAVSVGAVAVFRRPDDVAKAVHGWKIFGFVGGSVSFFFWLVEFFPEVGATRLEANNPAFSVWAVLLGIALALLFRLVWGEAAGRKGAAAGLMVAGLLCSLLPAVIIFGPVAWYQPRIVSMDRLHNFIMEFYTFSNFTKGKVLISLFQNFQFVLPVAAFVAVPAFFAKSASTRAAALVLFLLGAGLFLMSMRQIRWLAIFAPLLAVTAAVATSWICSKLWRSGAGWRLVGVALFIAMFVQGTALARTHMRDLFNVLEGRSLLNELVPAVLNKRFATSLAAAAHPPTIIMGDPSIAPAIAYFARIPVVASFYWENVDGDADAAEFFADSERQDSARIAAKRKLSHVIVPSGPLFPNYFDYIKHGNYDTERAKSTLASKLTEGSALSLPPWLEVDEELDPIGKAPYSFKGEVLEQYLNVYRADLGKIEGEKVKVGEN